MPVETLEFEEPIAVLLKEIEALELLPRIDARDREFESLRRRIVSVRAELYRSLTPCQRVMVARHPSRPGLEYFIDHLFTGFTELHGDRRFADDHAIMTGFAEYKGQPVLVVVRGKLERDEESVRVLASEILPIDSIRERLTREVAIRLTMPADRGTFEALGEVFARHRGDRRVSFEIELAGDARAIRVKADISSQIRVRPSSTLIAEVEQIVGPGAVELR